MELLTTCVIKSRINAERGSATAAANTPLCRRRCPDARLVLSPDPGSTPLLFFTFFFFFATGRGVEGLKRLRMAGMHAITRGHVWQHLRHTNVLAGLVLAFISHNLILRREGRRE